MSDYEFDLAVIGAGSGGTRAARIAAGHGARVAICEGDRFGGTCVIRGCVPKKLLVYASRFADEFELSKDFGWTPGAASFDWSALIAAKNKEIARLESVYKRGLETAGVTVHSAFARLLDPHTIQIPSTQETFTGDKILIATGGRPNFDASVPGIEHTITSDEAFHLTALPDDIVIVGGGYIAVEFAGIFSGLGSNVTLVYRGEKFLRGFDDDLRHGLAKAYRERGINLVFQTNIAKIDKTNGRLKVYLTQHDIIEADKVMYAIGRHPNIEGLGLDKAGVKTGKNGKVFVDNEHRTSMPNIFAVGDVCDRVNLTPVAIREGHAFADTQFGNAPRTVDHDWIPTAVFATPEIGTVGFTEQQAREKFGAIDIYKSEFRPMKASLGANEEKMMMKLIVAGSTDRVVGCHILGDDAAEIVQMAAISMRMGATKADFDATMALHPSASEELVTLREKWNPQSAAA